MMIHFYKGVRRTERGEEVSVSWAETASGVTALAAGTDEPVHELNMNRVTAVEKIATLDLPGLDREGIDVIVDNILKGGYLDKPGAKGKGEAVLFMLVNEAIHRLTEIAKDENED